MYKNGLVDGIYLNKIYLQQLHILLSNTNIQILFPYLRPWLDHVPLNSSQAFCGEFFSCSLETVLKAHPQAHEYKNQLSNEWKQH